MSLLRQKSIIFFFYYPVINFYIFYIHMQVP